MIDSSKFAEVGPVAQSSLVVTGAEAGYSSLEVQEGATSLKGQTTISAPTTIDVRKWDPSPSTDADAVRKGEGGPDGSCCPHLACRHRMSAPSL